MAKSEDITFDKSAHERCANGHGRERQYAGLRHYHIPLYMFAQASKNAYCNTRT